MYAASPPRQHVSAAEVRAGEEDFSVGPSLFHMDADGVREGGGSGYRVKQAWEVEAPRGDEIVIWGRPDLSPSMGPMKPGPEVGIVLLCFEKSP